MFAGSTFGFQSSAKPVRGIKFGQPSACLTADVAEATSDIEMPTSEQHRRHGAIGLGVPRRCTAGGRVERGEIKSRLPANVVEVTAHVESVLMHRQGCDEAVRVRIPVKSLAGSGVQGGDVLARLARDGREPPRHIDRVARYEQPSDSIWDVVRARVPCRDAPVREDMRKTVARHAAHSAKVASNEPSPVAIWSDAVDVARHLGERYKRDRESPG